MMRLKEVSKNQVTLEVSGTLEKSDYEEVVPQLEKLVEDNEKLRALVELNDFHGIKPSALVDELRFDLRHRNDFEKCAILGEGAAQKWLTKIASPFFSGEVRFFDKKEIRQAKDWLAAA